MILLRDFPSIRGGFPGHLSRDRFSITRIRFSSQMQIDHRSVLDCFAACSGVQQTRPVQSIVIRAKCYHPNVMVAST